MKDNKRLDHGCIKIARCGRALLVAIPARDFSDWEYIAENKALYWSAPDGPAPGIR